MRLAPRTIALCAAGVFVLAGLTIVYLVHARGRWALGAYKKQLLSQGEKFALEDVLPEQVPASQNSAGLFREVAPFWGKQTGVLETNPPPVMRPVAPGKAMIGWKQPELCGDGTNTWEEAQADLAQHAEGLSELEQIIERPKLDFYLDYKQGFTLLLPHLAPLKRTAILLNSAAMCDLQRGDTPSAIRRLRTSLALVKGLADERIVISQLVRMAMANLALAGTWECLQSPQMTEEELAVLQKDWEGLSFLKPAENALVFQRAMMDRMANQMHESSAQYHNAAQIFGSGGSSISGNFLGNAGQAMIENGQEAMWRFAWSYPDQLRALKGDQAFIETVRMVEKGAPFEMSLDYEKRRLTDSGIKIQAQDDRRSPVDDINPRALFSNSVLALERFPHRLLRVEAARQLVVTALAIDRFRLRHGTYPSQLASLVPEFLPMTPRDPVDGQLLRYRLNADGSFLLYSIGEDSQDNGGDPSSATNSKDRGWLSGRDWVWPSPASDVEVQAFYQKGKGQRGR